MGGKIADNTVLVATDDQISETLDDEAVVLHIDSGTYYGLGGVGRHIWDLVQEPTTKAEIRAEILKEYDVNRKRAEDDAEEFLAQLVERDLLEVRR